MPLLQMQAQSAGKCTYYLTYFECLSENTLELVFAYHNFVERLIIHLGEDWRIESNLLWDQYHKKDDPEGCSNIFNVYLMVFLKGRVNCQSAESDKSENALLDEYQERVAKEFSRGLETKADELSETLSFKTLSVGFFVTALELWEASFSTLNQDHKTLTGELKQLAICHEIQEEQPDPRKLRKLSASNHTESMYAGFQNLQLVSSSAKPQEPLDNYKRQRQSNIEWRKFGPNDSLPATFLQKLKTAIQTSKKCEKWQLIATFIINILEVRYSRDSKKHLIRVIRICRQFYQSAVMLWMLFNAKNNYSMNFKEYESYVKYILQDKWQQSYTLPLKSIYTVLNKEWNQIVKEHAIDLNEDNQVIRIFFSRIRGSLHELWEQKIIKINPEVFT